MNRTNTHNWNEKMAQKRPNKPKVEVLAKDNDTFVFKGEQRGNTWIETDTIVNLRDFL